MGKNMALPSGHTIKAFFSHNSLAHFNSFAKPSLLAFVDVLYIPKSEMTPIFLSL